MEAGRLPTYYTTAATEWEDTTTHCYGVVLDGLHQQLPTATHSLPWLGGVVLPGALSVP